MDKITLKNFQGHEDSTIELAQLITAVVGRSDKGKSSVIRACKLVRDNKPTGDAFVRKGTEEMTVIIDNVRRVKTKSLNAYKVDGHKDPYKALRGAVPEEITTALNLGKENIQEQHDAIFLLDQSSGKVAQKLSQLADLESTTKALQYIVAKKRKARSDLEATKKAIKVEEGNLFELRHTDDMHQELLKIEQDSAKVDVLRDTHSQVSIAVKNVTQAQLRLNSLPSTDALEPAKQLITDFKALHALKKGHTHLSSILDEHASIEYLLQFDPRKLLRKAKQVNKLIAEHTSLAACIKTHKRWDEKVLLYELRIEELQAEKLTLMGDTCPLCGGAVDAG